MQNKLFFALRHGERADRAFTHRPCPLNFDPCLTEKGLLQAEQSCQRILSLIPPNKSVHLVSSPFLRCIETASFIAKSLNIPIHIEEGFAEFLFTWDFDFNPLKKLHIRARGIPALEQEIGVRIIDNVHLPGSVYPETYEMGNNRIKSNWEVYFPRVNEEVVICVSHLFVVGSLTEVWLGRRYSISEDGYCKLTIGSYDGHKYEVKEVCDYSHATQ